VAVFLGLAGGSYFVYKYYQVASDLPDVGDLRNRASQFETTRILDRNGQTLYEILDPTAGRRTYIFAFPNFAQFVGGNHLHRRPRILHAPRL